MGEHNLSKSNLIDEEGHAHHALCAVAKSHYTAHIEAVLNYDEMLSDPYQQEIDSFSNNYMYMQVSLSGKLLHYCIHRSILQKQMRIYSWPCNCTMQL